MRGRVIAPAYAGRPRHREGEIRSHEPRTHHAWQNAVSVLHCQYQIRVWPLGFFTAVVMRTGSHSHIYSLRMKPTKFSCRSATALHYFMTLSIIWLFSCLHPAGRVPPLA